MSEEINDENLNEKSDFDKMADMFENDGPKADDGQPHLGKSGLKIVPADQLPIELRQCERVYSTTMDGKTNHVFMGVSGENVLFSFGTGHAFALDKNTVRYLNGSIQQLTSVISHKEFGVNDFPKQVSDERSKMGFDAIEVGPMKQVQQKKVSDESMEEFKERMVDNIDDSKSQEEYKKMKLETENFIKDAEDKMESMTPEEKAQFKKKLEKKIHDLQNRSTREFEKMLLGEIEEEEEESYDYAYFKAAFDKGGTAALREEMAKLPEDQRPEMIKKIVEEAEKEKRRAQQNQNSNDDKEDTQENSED